MVVGEGLQEGDVAPISTDNRVIKVVSDFKYLGTLVSSNGRIERKLNGKWKLKRELAILLGCLACCGRLSFQDSDLTVTSKR